MRIAPLRPRGGCTMTFRVFVAVAALAVGTAAPLAAQTAAATTSSQDKTLDSRIEKRISSDAALKRYDIKVDVTDGVATLTGTVATDAERTKAASLAKVTGITRVDNRIVTDLD